MFKFLYIFDWSWEQIKIDEIYKINEATFKKGHKREHLA